jgi:flagellar biosynthesis protein FlhB
MAADDDDKTEEPTQQRIDEARKKGDVVNSPEVGAAFMLLAATAFVGIMSGPIAESMGRLLTGLLAHAGDMPADGHALVKLYAHIGLQVGGAMGLALVLLSAAGAIGRFVQDKPVFSSERLKPKLDNLDPIKGAGRVFGKQALGNFAKAAVKLLAVGGAIAYTLWPRDGSLTILSLLDPAALAPLMRERTLSLLITCTIAAGVIAAADYFFAYQEHRKRLRMSRQELKEEFRQSEGDPMVKAKLRQIRMERSQRRMMAAVPEATVIITNPTHYAVALKYDQDENPAPICVAKGVNEVALKIREVAGEHAVPIVEDPPLARALYASAELDRQIPREHFEAVAKIIGYVMRLAARRRGR